MKIRQKLLLTYLGLASAALILVSAWAYFTQARVLKAQVMQQLDAIAEIQKNRLHGMMVQNREHLALVTSRTQLRLSLKRYLEKGQPQHLQKIRRILGDAQNSVNDFKVISVTDISGKVAVSTDSRLQGKRVYDEGLLARARQMPNVDTVELGDDDQVRLIFSAPLVLKEQAIGLIVIEVDGHPITDLTTDYTGLGQSGETMLAVRQGEDEFIYIAPLRADHSAAMHHAVSMNETQLPMVQALQQSLLTSGEFRDYRQVPVLASTRYLASAGWGLVVKIDRQEALAPIAALRNSLAVISLGVLLLMVLISVLLADKITRPLHSLTHAAKRIAAGDYSQRVRAGSRDETGTLAGAFNQMMSALGKTSRELDQRLTQLSDEVQERKLAEEKLKEYQDHLEELVDARTAALQASNQELKAFSYTVTHDLRAPLRSIDGFSQALEEDCAGQLDDTGKGHLDRIHHNILRMGALIDDLLRLSSVANEKLQRVDIDISEMCADILRACQHNEPERQVDIKIEEHMLANGDRELVRIALENLIGNAWKYSSKKPLTRIHVAQTAGHGGVSTICVKDEGAGFDMAKSSNLFAPFQRYHSREFEGTGIGLATVQRIVARHHGEIWADATPDQGAAFCFTLSSIDGARANTGDE